MCVSVRPVGFLTVILCSSCLVTIMSIYISLCRKVTIKKSWRQLLRTPFILKENFTFQLEDLEQYSKSFLSVRNQNFYQKVKWRHYSSDSQGIIQSIWSGSFLTTSLLPGNNTISITSYLAKIFQLTFLVVQYFTLWLRKYSLILCKLFNVKHFSCKK